MWPWPNAGPDRTVDPLPPLWENAAWVLVGIAGFAWGWLLWAKTKDWDLEEEARYWLEDR